MWLRNPDNGITTRKSTHTLVSTLLPGREVLAYCRNFEKYKEENENEPSSHYSEIITVSILVHFFPIL